MSEISDSDRFECKVINVIDNKNWKGVVVEHLESKGRVYFGRLKPDCSDINQGDTLYIGAKPVNFEFGDRTMEVSLYDRNNNRLDWTFI
ncbi:conserved hypothetical protein [Methanosalsum zhilinae DSM 4017]|uniref:Uncharacterized protein n=1 Tax=Methanosalsum zhilinae (strain DSM 4017 / NBRC 107636 / OCM 62 / WeN5) TaxID=679901 RepID=F7XNG7_METZD|nr:hypothetical protein [Methanosalsum zhilinae]AEH61220.1 conserved hypothetical protein [Methanosalsum zhilinae DSM 4017]